MEPQGIASATAKAPCWSPRGAKEAFKQRLAGLFGHMWPQSDAKRLPEAPKWLLRSAKRLLSDAEVTASGPKSIPSDPRQNPR